MDDPAGQSGKVVACATSLQRVEAISKLQDAVHRAENAKEDEDKDDVAGAFYWWDLVFNGNFPSHYY